MQSASLHRELGPRRGHESEALLGLDLYPLVPDGLQEIDDRTNHGKVPANAGQEPLFLRGITVDHEGHAWIAANNHCGLGRFDTRAENWLGTLLALESCVEPVGVSLGRGDRIWVVDRGAESVYRLNRDSLEYEFMTGFVRPYSYSDMTGRALALQIGLR